jgi:hypothetical protein
MKRERIAHPASVMHVTTVTIGFWDHKIPGTPIINNQKVLDEPPRTKHGIARKIVACARKPRVNHEKSQFVHQWL